MKVVVYGLMCYLFGSIMMLLLFKHVELWGQLTVGVTFGLMLYSAGRYVQHQLRRRLLDQLIKVVRSSRQA